MDEYGLFTYNFSGVRGRRRNNAAVVKHDGYG